MFPDPKRPSIPPHFKYFFGITSVVILILIIVALIKIKTAAP